jgi:hypothetical protein
MHRIEQWTLVALLALAAPLHAASVPQDRAPAQVAYASGGVSEESRDNLNAIAGDFNLKVVMATKTGEYLSDVDVVITDDRGRPLVSAVADGPWFFARLPSGHYVVSASTHGTTQRKSVTLGDRQARVDLRWDE